MRIDLPLCNFKLCRKCFDGNCTGGENDRMKCEQFKNNWIHVKEALPEETQRVLATLKNKMVLEVFFINNKFKYQGIMKGGGMSEVSQNNPVIAWQPLPEPYKEGSNE